MQYIILDPGCYNSKERINNKPKTESRSVKGSSGDDI